MEITTSPHTRNCNASMETRHCNGHMHTVDYNVRICTQSTVMSIIMPICTQEIVMSICTQQEIVMCTCTQDIATTLNKPRCLWLLHPFPTPCRPPSQYICFQPRCRCTCQTYVRLGGHMSDLVHEWPTLPSRLYQADFTKPTLPSRLCSSNMTQPTLLRSSCPVGGG